MIYAVGVVLLIGTLAGFMFYMYNWYQYATVSSKVDQLGLTLVDRIVRDVRSGSNIDLAQSSFDTANGAIFINTKVGGVATTKEFLLSSGRVQYRENGGTAQYLSPANMSVSRLWFTNLPTPISKAVRVELEITYDTKSGAVTHGFNGLSILRQSY